MDCQVFLFLFLLFPCYYLSETLNQVFLIYLLFNVLKFKGSFPHWKGRTIRAKSFFINLNKRTCDVCYLPFSSYLHLRFLYHFTTIIRDAVNAYIYVFTCLVRNTDRAPRSSGRRNNVLSWISEVKDTSNVGVRKKRGRRAPPSAKRLRDKRVDKAIESDGAVDSDSDDTDGQVDKNQPSAHIEEHVDGRTGDDLATAGHSGNSSNGPSSASEEKDHSTNSKDKLQKASSQNTKKVFGNSTNGKQGASNLEQECANEDGSHVLVAAVYKDIDNERSSQKIRDDVSFLLFVLVFFVLFMITCIVYMKNANLYH